MEPPKVSASSGVGTIHASDSGSLGALNLNDPLAILGAAPMPDEPWWQRFSPSTLFVLISCAIAIFFLGHELSTAGKLGFPDDDAWTQQVFAKNFFHHLAFEFNANERVASPESPFWIVFLSVGVGLFHDPILTAKLLGAIFLFLTGYYTYRVLKSASFERLSALIGGALVITSSALAASELSGLETCLASALVLGGIWWHAAMRRDGWSHAAVTGAIFALAALTCPEATLIFFTVLLHSFFGGSHRFRNVLLMALAFALILAPIAITNYAVAGNALPPAVIASLSDNGGSIFTRLGTSLQSVWIAVRDLYAPEHPLWVMTIVLAAISRARRKLVHPDAIDHLFSLSLLVLVLFPYLDSVITGTHSFEGHEFGLLIAVYHLTGVLSLYVLVRRELFRIVTPKRMLIGLSVVLLIAGGIVALQLHEVTTFVLLCLLLPSFGYIALHYCDLSIRKREQPHEVMEADRLKVEFGSRESGGLLSEPATQVLCGALMIACAWNLARLPHAASDFARQVNSENTTEIAMAHAIASVTPPQDAVAATEIGAIGFFGERRIIDLSGELDTTRGAVAIVAFTPKHLATFGDIDSLTIRHGLSRGLLLLEVRSNPRDKRAALYRITSWDAVAWRQP